MSSPQEQGRAVPVADAAPGDAAPMRITASGNHGIPVLITPSGTGTGTAPFQGFLVFQEAAKKDEEQEDDLLAQRKKWFPEMRGWLMVLATIGASVAYQAGLNPPGGFWQDNNDHHNPGDPVLRDQHWVNYAIFYYFNATAFVTSMVIMVLLVSEKFHGEAKLLALMFATFVDLSSLVGAYIAGTTRHASSCVYIIVIICVTFFYVIFGGEVMREICTFVLQRIRCMRNLAKLKWCPVPVDVVTKSLPEEERRKRAKRSKRPCCLCCEPSTSTPDRQDVEGQ